ncbi:MAG: TIGR00725 family protein [Gammaproteobacteria bacterium]|nr:TIGR00725 family protein [Gammaproteobacteria bacterium]MCB9660525.1 TIGR00725 family protein [Sandaracinaceae bacterium]
MRPRLPVAAVVGARSASASALVVAESLGTGLVDAGFRLVTGGMGGVMEAASRGARRSPRWTDGAVVGVLPGLSASDANSFVDIVIPTGMNYARNVIVVAMADVVVALGGGSGTLSEIALAWQHGKPIVALDIGEGWSSRLAGEQLDHRRRDVVHRAGCVGDAVELAARLVGTVEGSRGF